MARILPRPSTTISLQSRSFYPSPEPILEENEELTEEARFAIKFSDQMHSVAEKRQQDLIQTFIPTHEQRLIRAWSNVEQAQTNADRIIKSQQAMSTLLDCLQHFPQHDVKVYNVESLHVNDYMVVVTCFDVATMHLFAGLLVKLARQLGILRSQQHPRVLALEHSRESDDWVLVDMGDVAVHFFLPGARKFHNVESALSSLVVPPLEYNKLPIPTQHTRRKALKDARRHNHKLRQRHNRSQSPSPPSPSPSLSPLSSSSSSSSSSLSPGHLSPPSPSRRRRAAATAKSSAMPSPSPLTSSLSSSPSLSQSPPSPSLPNNKTYNQNTPYPVDWTEGGLHLFACNVVVNSNANKDWFNDVFFTNNAKHGLPPTPSVNQNNSNKSKKASRKKRSHKAR